MTGDAVILAGAGVIINLVCGSGCGCSAAKLVTLVMIRTLVNIMRLKIFIHESFNVSSYV